jgi:hypothetical protein
MCRGTNDDGSADIYCAPTPPPGFEKNWIPTVPGKAWFAYFRLYAPGEVYFDKSFPLPDIEQLSCASTANPACSPRERAIVDRSVRK